MLSKEKIARINELAKKAKAVWINRSRSQRTIKIKKRVFRHFSYFYARYINKYDNYRS